ncbi:Uncharacterized protein FWK35_00031131 [Aphis craccivora]|uniref:Uncharacterized protein n=1 Tax=Aphis craccivora TaxID=307492 RepID=A0A6G0VY73_APHCR|nr:Uncharacterized protein FWK35_00031131 [Aphis craccivora]
MTSSDCRLLDKAFENNFFVTPTPKVWFSTAVEALESDLFLSSGIVPSGKVEITNSDGRKVKNANSDKK